MKTLINCSLLLLLAGCETVFKQESERDTILTAESICEFTRDSEPEGLSGISRIEENRYYCVNDRDGLLHEMEITLNDEGEVALCQAVRSIRLKGRVDLEGCAIDPLTKYVWVSDEHDHSVRAFDPKTGNEKGRVTIPEVFLTNMVQNLSFEALAVSPGGLRLYVANEDTLRCDGARASREKGGTVRIQEFERARGKNQPWVPQRQFLYPTEKIEGKPFNNLQVSGVVSLCVLDSKTLLVLEREMSQKNPYFPSFLMRLYAVALNQPSGPVSKYLVWEEDTSFSNYEGLCCGPLLKDGRQTLLLVSDGGGKASKSILVLALSKEK